MMKKALVTLVLLTAPALAFAGGPVNPPSIQSQLRQEAVVVRADIASAKQGIPIAMMLPGVQKLDFELQNTATQMHVKADFPGMTSAMFKVPDRAALLKNLEQDQKWVAARQK